MMKKQILFLTFFVLASFAGMTDVFGQLTGNIATCPVPEPLDPACLTSDALHPIPGQSYNYSVSVPNIVSGSGEYHWFVTQDQDFITSGALNTSGADVPPGTWIAATGTGYNNITTGTDNIDITWKSFVHDATQPVFVVIQVRGTDAADCPINNLKVYVIEPVNAFTLDIAAITDAPAGTNVTYGPTAESCFPDVVSAIWDATNNEVDYNFGVSSTYFMVTAASYSESWRPRFQVAGLDAIQEVAVDWAYSATPTVWNPMTGPGTPNGIYTTTGVVAVQDASGAVGSDGECILVRVTVTHNHFEGIADQPFTLAVDGETQLSLTTPFKDLHHTTCLDDNFDNDVATHTLTQRPDIQSTTPGVAPNDNPGLFLPVGAE